MNATANPQRIIATNIRTTAEQLDAWRDLYAVTYPAHRMSFNAWLISMIQEGIDSREWRDVFAGGRAIHEEAVTAARYAADCPPTGGEQK